MSDAQIINDTRQLKPAMWRGIRRCCPNCGDGALFDGYLSVSKTCPSCQEELYHHRADDGPAYLTILLVAHVIGFAMHFMWAQFRPEPLLMAAILGVGAVALSLYLLPRLKGMIVAIQWAKRMHGFGHNA
ncbi:DUF983 domain-containing protein [Yoonia sediminilitoris]|uniref:Uncharacterized protein (DUF983 family) n=1 Tax=Yoonia sediminilitoris TaxID=1286148 RepID=A0A2T6KB63_9RHOB|nr:DUF983 domain-containing protein [Yoonia sediminilitoris]PUB12090.1 uncharacterized protein (DUF983 family) [Yoonia sediminilitoris]RCW92917.1 uncharacterized protein (DUF983 family) [Yoonia sediminilitoris]